MVWVAKFRTQYGILSLCEFCYDRTGRTQTMIYNIEFDQNVRQLPSGKIPKESLKIKNGLVHRNQHKNYRTRIGISKIDHEIIVENAC